MRAAKAFNKDDFQNCLVPKEVPLIQQQEWEYNKFQWRKFKNYFGTRKAQDICERPPGSKGQACFVSIQDSCLRNHGTIACTQNRFIL